MVEPTTYQNILSSIKMSYLMHYSFNQPLSEDLISDLMIEHNLNLQSMDDIYPDLIKDLQSLNDNVLFNDPKASLDLPEKISRFMIRSYERIYRDDLIARTPAEILSVVFPQSLAPQVACQAKSSNAIAEPNPISTVTALELQLTQALVKSQQFEKEIAAYKQQDDSNGRNIIALARRLQNLEAQQKLNENIISTLNKELLDQKKKFIELLSFNNEAHIAKLIKLQQENNKLKEHNSDLRTAAVYLLSRNQSNNRENRANTSQLVEVNDSGVQTELDQKIQIPAFTAQPLPEPAAVTPMLQHLTSSSALSSTLFPATPNHTALYGSGFMPQNSHYRQASLTGINLEQNSLSYSPSPLSLNCSSISRESYAESSVNLRVNSPLKQTTIIDVNTLSKKISYNLNTNPTAASNLKFLSSKRNDNHSDIKSYNQNRPNTLRDLMKIGPNGFYFPAAPKDLSPPAEPISSSPEDVAVQPAQPKLRKHGYNAKQAEAWLHSIQAIKEQYPDKLVKFTFDNTFKKHDYQLIKATIKKCSPPSLDLTNVVIMNHLEEDITSQLFEKSSSSHSPVPSKRK